MAIEFKNTFNQRKSSTDNTRAGLPTNLTPEELKIILSYSNDEDLLLKGNSDLLSPKIKKYFDQGLYSPKTFSKKSSEFISGAQNLLNQNYNGKIFSSGWLDEISVANKQKILFRLGSNLFYDRDNLPYSDATTSGVYIDEVWSGYNVPWNNNKVLGGFIISGIDNISDYPESGKFKRHPYRNFYEIFEHSGIQIGDMGNQAFSSGGYVPGQFIGYNAIYFKSGLNKYNILDKNPQFLFVPNPLWAKVNNKKSIINSGIFDHSNNPRNYPSPAKEKQNLIRWNVFVYTGNLNFKINPPSGDIYSNYVANVVDKTKTTLKLQPQKPIIISRINATGIFPEILTKNFSILNRSINPVAVYLSASHPAIQFEYPNSFVENKSFEVTNETGYFNSSKIDKISILSSAASANIKAVINTSLLAPGNMEEKIYIHYVTGIKNIASEETQRLDFDPKSDLKSDGLLRFARSSKIIGSGLASYTRDLNLNISCIDNDSKITTDDFYFEIRSGFNYFPVKQIGQAFEYDTTGLKNQSNDSFGVSFYSTGVNFWEDQETRIDLLNKIYKSGEYHPTTGRFKNIKNIYPLANGEGYVALYSCPKWIKPLNDKTSLKWISGYSGFFNSWKGFNPATGALQGDISFKFNFDELLPKDANLSGYNFIVETRNAQAPVIYSQNQSFDLQELALDTEIALDRSKSYRFFQINNINDQKFGFLGQDKLSYKVYEPEYNSSQYRIIDLFLNNNTPEEITWTGNSNISGKFKVVGTRNNLKSTSSGVYDIYTFSNRIDYTEVKNYFQENKNFVFFVNDYETGLSPRINPNLDLSIDKSYIFNYFTISGLTGASDFRFFKRKVDAPNIGSLENFSFPNSSTGNYQSIAMFSGVPVLNKQVIFDIPNGFDINQEIFVGFNDKQNLLPVRFYRGKINSGSEILLSGSHNFSNVIAPVHSGNLVFITTDTSKYINLPIVMSGVAGQTFYSKR